MGKKYSLIQALFLIVPFLGMVVSVSMSFVNIFIIYKNKKIGFLWWISSSITFLMIFALLNFTGFMEFMRRGIIIKVLVSSLIFLLFGIICLLFEKFYIKKFILK